MALFPGPLPGFLLFVPRGEAKSVTGKEIPAVSINHNETSEHRVTMVDRGKYQAVAAH
uniref:Uncharacterized protein n=1 Tax=Candidatus Kentrum sp. TUN TaxID=2126343 RepID=A0A451A236_9GAMM|nr:MAG: hypothetical protein BECKTUN1418F_GA0071002_11996 [Candidatus Kentron sp. TUN]VFK69496.1 MAG: hypothetical protein BECKTUN1418E_GA0071001_11967 [Candidatus Kentron sp. TUN]